MIMRLVICLVFCLLSVSCFKKKAAPGDSTIFLTSKRLGELTDKKLQEVSGLAASSANPGYLWTHNDSGNPAVVYLVDENLEIRLTCKLQGAKNRDWEDIAVGPGPDANKRYVYVADIGDNNARYAIKFIYRFEEPILTDKSEINITSFDTIAFRLADGKKDTEAIMIHPQTKNIYVVSKREKPVWVYELKYPYALRDTSTAAKIVSVPLTQIVAAGISPDGSDIIMKNYDNIYYWNMKGKPISEALTEKPEKLQYTEEPQGEAIGFNVEGSGFYTLSERISGEKSFLYFYGRQSGK
ncbi:MAG: hypothetical protein WD824_00555 [Cyclobacteriaceae bacterium]